MRLRLATTLLGGWIALSLGMAAVAAVNFRTVDEVIAPGYRPELEARLRPLAPGEARPVLRFLASELNRRFFRRWAEAQVGFSILLLVLAVGSPVVRRPARVFSGAAAALAVALRFVLTPAILRLGPPLDFVPRPFPPEWAEAARAFRLWHGAYMALDLLKLVLLAVVLVLLLRTRERPRSWDLGPGG